MNYTWAKGGTRSDEGDGSAKGHSEVNLAEGRRGRRGLEMVAGSVSPPMTLDLVYLPLGFPSYLFAVSCRRKSDISGSG